MESRRIKVVRTPFAAIPRNPNARVLTLFGVPIVDENPTVTTVKRPQLLKSIPSSVSYVSESAAAPLPAVKKSCGLDILPFVQTLNTSTLTDDEAEAIADPYSAYNYRPEDILSALLVRLEETSSLIGWNKPRGRPQWQEDLRFYGEWWVTLRGLSSPRDVVTKTRAAMGATKDDVYRPLIMGDLTAWEEDQLLADLTKRMQEKVYRLDLLHFDEFTLAPDRMHVLMMDGVMRLKRTVSRSGPITVSNVLVSFPSATVFHRSLSPPYGGKKRRSSLRSNRSVSSAGSCASPEAGSASPESFHAEINSPNIPSGSIQSPVDASREHGKISFMRGSSLLETLSFSICRISTASLLVLLACLTADEPPYTLNLDVSYNLLTQSSLYTLTVFLPKTSIIRLSLRGNNLKGMDFAAFRDFLLEGCRRLEELDLSFTELGVPQMCILIECIPIMKNLHALLLDGVEIPLEKTAALTRAVYQSQLWYLSISGSRAAANTAYLNCIHNACEKRWEHLTGNSSMAATKSQSFFDTLFTKSLKNGWRPPYVGALCDDYRAFTNNNPSLYTDVA